MASMSLAITSAGGRARLAYPTVFPYADPRAIGITVPPPITPATVAGDLADRSDFVHDRLTLSSRVVQAPQTDRATQRKQPLARPSTRNPSGNLLAEMADSVADRVTLTRPKEKNSAQRTGYSKSGEPGWSMAGETSPGLEALAADVNDQVTLSGGTADSGANDAEITVYIGGNERAGYRGEGAPSPTGLSRLPAGA